MRKITIEFANLEKTVKFEAVGKCIYCRSDKYAEDSRRNLATEHIIPYGLNGNILLPESTCRKCEKITGQTESIVLRGALLGCRTILGLKTRSPKDRPKLLPLFNTERSPENKVMVEIADYPSAILLCQLGPPAVLSAIKTSGSISSFWHYRFKDPDFIKLYLKYGIRSFALPSLDGKAFCMMLAKIAHAYSSAIVGIDRFDPMLTEFIRGRSSEIWPSFVGGIPSDVPADDFLHSIEIEDDSSFVIVRLRLFANLGAPVYRIVAGRKISF